MNHDAIRRLSPKPLWNAFVDLNAIPRPSKREEAVSQWVAQRGLALGLESLRDTYGNVLIRKPGRNRIGSTIPVVLQSHLDMVCQKNRDTDFNFETQGIRMRVDGDWVVAEGTTLGADNGIGVAAMLAILEERDGIHPPLECLFTVDEEAGMTGAKNLDPTWLSGKVLLNLDTEQDNELTIGCAGGADVTILAEYREESIDDESLLFRLIVRGLVGGHSGMDIHLGRANANKWMNRLLEQAGRHFGLKLISLEGGSLRNAIPRESIATIAIPKPNADSFAIWLMKESITIRMEYEETDPGAQIFCEPIDTEAKHRGMSHCDFVRLTSVIDGIVNGIVRMSPSIHGLVQSSNNLAKVAVAEGSIAIMCLCRSSVDGERDEVARGIASVGHLLGGETRITGQYSGWQPSRSTKTLERMVDLYRDMFASEPHVSACHAGLECGIIGGNVPGMEMVSFGPNIVGAHSPDERVQISSVQKFYRYLKEILATIG